MENVNIVHPIKKILNCKWVKISSAIGAKLNAKQTPQYEGTDTTHYFAPFLFSYTCFVFYGTGRQRQIKYRGRSSK